MLQRYVRWLDPQSGTCTPLYQIATIREAIEHQRSVGRAKGYDYATDEEALADFKANHWAIEVVMDVADHASSFTSLPVSWPA